MTVMKITVTHAKATFLPQIIIFLQDDLHYHSRNSLLGASCNDHSAAMAQAPVGPQVKQKRFSQLTASPALLVRCLPLGDCACCSFLGACLSWESQTITT